MIIGLFEYNKNQIYYQNSNNFKRAIEIIQNTNFSNIDDGRYEIDGPDFYYLLTTYKITKYEEKPNAEVHRKYIDLHYIIYGMELICHANYKNSKRSVSDYDIQKDVELFDIVSDESVLLVKKDMFTVFYPYEIHRSGLIREESGSIRKIVFKILSKEAK